MAQMAHVFLDEVENIVGEGENVGYQQAHRPFATIFFTWMIKVDFVR